MPCNAVQRHATQCHAIRFNTKQLVSGQPPTNECASPAFMHVFFSSMPHHMFQIRLGGICGVVRTTSAELHAWWCEHPLKGGVEMQAMDVAPLANGYLSQLFVVTVVDVLNDVGVVPL
jgi:hypothetical protein